MRVDEKFMAVSLEAARLGRGSVEPNPMVGAVIVRDGVELARGHHVRFGGPHAEIEAIAAARAAGHDLRGATIYVTLEPCCHHGKTPPCTKALIEAGFARVVAAMVDPDDRVAGKGLAELEKAGIATATGVLEQQARELLAAYIKLRTQHRPWVICKWAQTADGYLALPPKAGRWVSCEQSRQEVHALRGECDGILVGVGTVLADDPLLTNRSGAGRQPARVVLDSHLRTPLSSQLIRTAGDAPVIIACPAKAAAANKAAADALRAASAQILELPAKDPHSLDPYSINLASLLDELGRRQWTHLLVEGGVRVLESFIAPVGLGVKADAKPLADELLVYVSPTVVGPDAPLPLFDVNDLLIQLHPRLTVKERAQIGADLRYRIHLTF